jgi:excisionase family DNA binding protein
MTGDGLMDKKELAEYLKLKVPTINKMLARDEIPGVVRLSGKIVRFNKARIEEWVEALTSDKVAAKPIQDVRKHYRRRIFNIPGKRGNFSWQGILRKIEELAKKRKVNLAKDVYPLFLFQEVLDINEKAFIGLLERLARENIIELTSISPRDIKKGMKIYELPRLSKDKKYYSFLYK